MVGSCQKTPLEILALRTRGGSYHSARKNVSGRVFYNHEYGIKNHSEFDARFEVSTDLSNYTGFLVHGNIAGVQFHPEKSQSTGQNILQMLV